MFTANRVLAVDDNPTNLAIIEESLQGKYDLRLASNGDEALQLAPTFLPDVVLLDAMMPNPDGYEVCRRMKNDPDLRHSRIIMVSAKSYLDDRLRGYSAGADDYVTKPFDEEELCAKVYASLRNMSMAASAQHQLDAICVAAGETLVLVSQLCGAESADHLFRIQSFSHILAAELRQGPFAEQIGDVFLDNLDRASVLHDIGKIAVPEKILRKQKKLTAAEFEQFKRHTLIGERILKGLTGQGDETGQFQMAADIARWHHECFDGSGYPDGLQGSAIPLAARIVKVADDFDALTATHDKMRFRPTEAREAMTSEKRSTFDPVIVDAFVRVFDELVDLCRSDDSPAPPGLVR